MERIEFKKADEFNESLTNKEMRLLLKAYKLSLKEVNALLSDIRNTYSDNWFSMPKYKRLQSIAYQINQIIKALTKKTDITIEKGIKSSYISSYKLTEEVLGISLALIDQVAVIKAIKNPFLKVSTIERNEKNLRDLRNELTQNIIQGKSYQTTARVVSERFSVALSKSDRIVRTENHRVQIDARIDGFKSAEKMGINIMKEWVAAIDERTRASHRGLNGTILPINDKFKSSSGGYGYGPGQMGTAADDINCRCSLAAVVL